VKIRNKKDAFAALDDAFKAEVAGMSMPEINARIAEWAKLAEENATAMKEDEDLAQLKAAVKLALEPYRETAKGAKLRIAFGLRVLKDRGAE
jgi:hypothetical protein